MIVGLPQIYLCFCKILLAQGIFHINTHAEENELQENKTALWQEGCKQQI
jgi:hypothetical protein